MLKNDIYTGISFVVHKLNEKCKIDLCFFTLRFSLRSVGGQGVGLRLLFRNSLSIKMTIFPPFSQA